MTVLVIEDVFIDLIADHCHMGMLAQHIGQLRQSLLRIDRARRIGGTIEHQQQGAGGDGCRQGRTAELVVPILAVGNHHAAEPRQMDHGGIAEPIGGWNNHLVTRLQQYLKEGVKRLLGPIADPDFIRAVGQLVLRLKLVGDGLPQGRFATGPVAGVSSLHGLCRGPA